MSRPPTRPGQKRPVQAKPKRPVPSLPRVGVTSVDPETEQAVNRLFMRLIRRVALTCGIMFATGWLVTWVAKSSHAVSVPVIYYAILLGVAIVYYRGVEQVFADVRQLGIEKLKQRRYADAVFALENFHRVGNMNRDRTGEAHYYLMQAYRGMGQTEKATEARDWLQKHRSKSEWATRATQETPPASVA